ncbi:hypothetical protein [Streptomyces sp. NPDC002491]
MSRIHNVPVTARKSLVAELDGTGIVVGDIATDDARTLLVEFQGRTWRLRYMGDEIAWIVTGPDAEKGIGLVTSEIAWHIAGPTVDADHSA